MTKKTTKKDIVAPKTEFKLPVYNKDGKKVDDIELDKRFFDGSVNKSVIYQAVVCYQANRRLGCASTKTRSDVSGGGRKPWRQKGTGRARAGSSRSPIFRHGGVAFGPHPKDFSYTIPAKIKRLALRSSFNAKLNDNSLVLVDQIKFEHAKTKEAVKLLSALPTVAESFKSKKKILCVLEADKDTLRPMRNIRNLGLVRPEDITAYDILRHHKLLISKDALKKVIKRLSG